MGQSNAIMGQLDAIMGRTCALNVPAEAVCEVTCANVPRSHAEGGGGLGGSDGGGGEGGGHHGGGDGDGGRCGDGGNDGGRVGGGGGGGVGTTFLKKIDFKTLITKIMNPS